ncbi:MAG TPA: glycosyltransferase family 9 protein [bacterium]|nr:glycosyltransferase family 9 protein [bacterium]
MRILIFHAGALGDLANTLPAIGAMREKFEGAEVTAVGNLSWLALLKAAGVVDEALSLDGPGFHALFNDAPLPPELHEFLARFDLAVSWMRSPALLGHLRGAGLKVAALREEFPPGPGSGHVTGVMARPLKELGIGKVPEYPRLDLPEDALAAGPEFPGILVHPGSGSARKNWPAGNFAEAAARLSDLSGLPIASLAGPADQEAEVSLARALGPRLAARFANLTSIELASLLKSARLVLGNDSGVSHLAGALGSPVAAVFGPTDPAIWGVKQARAINLSPLPDREGLEGVSVERVVEAGMELLRMEKIGA